MKGLTACHPSRWRMDSSNLDTSNNGLLGPHKLDRQTASQSVQPFLCTLQEGLLIFFNGMDNPKIAHSSGEIWTPCHNTWFLGTTRVSPQNGISIHQPFLQGSRDQQKDKTDHAIPSVAIARI